MPLFVRGKLQALFMRTDITMLPVSQPGDLQREVRR